MRPRQVDIKKKYLFLIVFLLFPINLNNNSTISFFMYIIINGLKTWVNIFGNNKKPVLVYLHGWGTNNSHNSFFGNKQVFEVLSKHFYVIAPEHPGFIRSECPKKPWNMSDFAKHTNLVLEELKINSFILFGYSLGGTIASKYAYLFPKKVKKLILVNPATDVRVKNLSYAKKIISSEFIYRLKTFSLKWKKYLISFFFGVPKNLVTKNNALNWINLVNSDFKPRVNYSKIIPKTYLFWSKNDGFVTPFRDSSKYKDKVDFFFELDGNHVIIHSKPEIINFILRKAGLPK